MKILVTGSKGFIGKNLCLYLKNHGYEIIEYDLGSSEEDLKQAIKSSDFIVHLAGVNRPNDVSDFKKINFGLTKKIVELMEEFDCHSPILLGSSTQAALDNPYGESKALAESVINNYGFAGHSTYVVRFANVLASGASLITTAWSLLSAITLLGICRLRSIKKHPRLILFISTMYVQKF